MNSQKVPANTLLLQHWTELNQKLSDHQKGSIVFAVAIIAPYQNIEPESSQESSAKSGHSAVPSPRGFGELMGLSPSNKAPSPQIEM